MEEYKIQEPKKLTETNYNLYALPDNKRLVVLYKNKYTPVKNVRKEIKMLVIVLDDGNGTLLPFDAWEKDLYVLEPSA